MLSSSEEYLVALREGRYLQFLQWPQFLATLYQSGESGCDADGTVNLLIFEWLNNGFCEEDAKKVALLVAISDLTTRPIRANLAYALTSISIALLQCMVYQQSKACKKILCQGKMNVQQIDHLIQSPIEGFDKEILSRLLEQQQTIFYKWVADCDPTRVQKIAAQINEITQLRYLVEEYVTQLGSAKLADALYDSRLSMVKCLSAYLTAQTALTPEVSETIQNYITSINEMRPAAFELEYLAHFAPGNLTTSLLKSLSFIGSSFFHLLHPPTAETTTDSKSTIILD